MVSIISHYFPEISKQQADQFEALEALYRDWNSRINVISRKDMDNFYEHHVLHSLGIARVILFSRGTQVLDVGTGGGFPGIPLAIMFPETSFFLIDSIGKKIKVVKEVARELHLENVTCRQVRAEEIRQKFHFIVSRAVTTLPEFVQWVKGCISADSFNTLRNGILYLKGGDLTAEIAGFRHEIKEFALSEVFSESFFETKKVVYIGF
jgi:16S rRNA (guanine527-N7)-methyltransferase